MDTVGYFVFLAVIILVIVMIKAATKIEPYSGSGQPSEVSTAIAKLITAGDLESKSIEGLLLKSNEVALLSISKCQFFEPDVEESSSSVGGLFGVVGAGYTDITKTTKMSLVAVGTLLLTNQRLCFGWSSGIRAILISDISWMSAKGMDKEAYFGKPTISSPAIQISFESKEGTRKCIIHGIREELPISSIDDGDDKWFVSPESLEQAITILREQIATTKQHEKNGKEQKAITPKPEPSKEIIKVRCSSCKALVDEGAKFCPECGTSMM